MKPSRFVAFVSSERGSDGEQDKRRQQRGQEDSSWYQSHRHRIPLVALRERAGGYLLDVALETASPLRMGGADLFSRSVAIVTGKAVLPHEDRVGQYPGSARVQAVPPSQVLRLPPKAALDPR